MVRMKKILLILLFVVGTEIPLQASTIARLPKTGNVIRTIHSRTRQYLLLLKEETQLTDLKNGCLKMIKKTFSSTVIEEDFLLCAFSKKTSETEVYEKVEIDFGLTITTT